LAKLYFKKTLNGLIPSDSNTKVIYDKIPMRKVVRITLNVARNYEFHKKAMALVKIAFDNQDDFTDFDKFRASLTIRCGHIYPIKVHGKDHWLPESWAFNKMDNIKFEEFYRNLWGVIYNDIFDGVDAGQLNEAVLQEVREFMNA